MRAGTADELVLLFDKHGVIDIEVAWPRGPFKPASANQGTVSASCEDPLVESAQASSIGVREAA
jgi:hypothetical protein